jgi:hypothetical protein
MGTIERGPSKVTKNSSKCGLTLEFDHVTSCFQDVQVKAQAEMDDVRCTGQERSPTWATKAVCLILPRLSRKFCVGGPLLKGPYPNDYSTNKLILLFFFSQGKPVKLDISAYTKSENTRPEAFKELGSRHNPIVFMMKLHKLGGTQGV